MAYQQQKSAPTTGTQGTGTASTNPTVATNPKDEALAAAQKQGTNTPTLDKAGLKSDSVWPVVLNSGTSETDISVNTATKLGFKRGRAYSFDLDLHALQEGTDGGFKAPIGLSDLGAETSDLFVGGGANLKGAGSTSFMVDGDRDAKGNITPKSKFKVVAANNGLLNVLRLGSALRTGFEASAKAQGGSTTKQGPKGRYNVVVARMQTGQDPNKQDVRQEDSYQKDNGDRIAEAIRKTYHEMLIAGMMKDAGVPENLIKHRISSVMAGYNLGMRGVLASMSAHLEAKPEWYFMPKSLDLTPLANGVDTTWSLGASASLNTAHGKLFEAIKAHLVEKATMPWIAGSDPTDKNFQQLRNVLLEQVKAGIGKITHQDFFKTYEKIITSVAKEDAPYVDPKNKGSLKLEQFNTEGGVGGT